MASDIYYFRDIKQLSMLELNFFINHRETSVRSKRECLTERRRRTALEQDIKKKKKECKQ